MSGNFADKFFAGLKDEPYRLLPYKLEKMREFESLKASMGRVNPTGSANSTPAASSSKITQYDDFMSKMSRWQSLLKSYSEGN